MTTNNPWENRTQRQVAVASSGTIIKLTPDQITDAIRYLTAQLSPEQLNPIIVATPDGRARVIDTLREAASSHQIANIPPSPAEPLLDELFRATVGLGPIDRLLADEAVEQINILGPKTIILQQRGTWHQITDPRLLFSSDEHLQTVAANVVRRVGQELSRFTRPILDVRFAQPVLRIHINQTLRGNGLAMYIRRGRTLPFTIEQLLEWGNFNQEVANLLIEAAQRVIGMVILGPVGTGKTVLLEVCVNHLPNIPIVVVDDAGDFSTRHPWVATFDLPAASYSANDKSLLTLGAMTRAALREGDVLVVAEVRGPEEAGILISDAPSMRAVYTTAHGGSAEAGLSRLVSIAQRPPSPYAGTNSVNALRDDLATAFPLVIQVDRRGDRRFVSGVYHNMGWNRVDDRWNLRPLVLAEYQEDGTPLWNIIDGNLDGVKEIAILDNMQRGGLAVYETRDPRALANNALDLMGRGAWLQAAHILSQVVKLTPKDERIQGQLVTAMQEAGQAEQAEKEARQIIEHLQAFIEQRNWEQANKVTSKLLSKNPGVYVFVRRLFPAYPAAAKQIREGQAVLKLVNQILTRLEDIRGLPWQSLEGQLGQVEAVQVDLLPAKLKDELEAAHIKLIQQLITSSPATNSLFFEKKLVGLVGTNRANQIIATLRPFTGVAE